MIDHHIIASDFVADGGADGESQVDLRADAGERDDDRLRTSSQPDQRQPGCCRVGSRVDLVAGGHQRVELGRDDRPFGMRTDRATVIVAAHDDVEHLVGRSPDDRRCVDSRPAKVSTGRHDLLAAGHHVAGQIDCPDAEADMIAVARSGTPGSVPRDDRTFADWVKGAAGERNVGSDAACDVLGVEHATRVVAGGPPHHQRERSVVEGWELDSALRTGRRELLSQRVDHVAQLGDRDPRQRDFRAIPPPAVTGHDAPLRRTAAHLDPRLLDLHRTIEDTTVGADHPDGVLAFEPRHGGIDAQTDLLDPAVVRDSGALGQAGDRVGRDTAPLAGDHHVAQDGQRGALANGRPGSRAEPRHRALQLIELAGGLGDVGGHRVGG